MLMFKTPMLGERETAVVVEIDRLKASLEYSLQTPRRWTGLLRRNALARAIQGSNSIEGYNATEEDAIAAVEGEDPLDADDETWAAISGYREALTYVLQCADDPHFHHSTDIIRSLHFMMLQHDLTKKPGKWRPGAIYVRDDETGEVVYEGPAAELVPDLMDALVGSVKASGDPAVVNAAMAHLNLVMVHPFKDGNGRMARCLQTLVLARSGTLASQFSSIEEYLGRNTRAYYDVLAKVGGGSWNPQRDAMPWVRFCLVAHFRQATTLLRRMREIERLWDWLEQLVLTYHLPGRTIFALADAAAGLRVRNATYRASADVGQPLASRDLKALVDARLLVAKGERRGRY